MVGVFAVFFGLNRKAKKNNVEVREQQIDCTDSILMRQNNTDSFEYQKPIKAQGTDAVNSSEMQSRIEHLQRQNDSLRIKLIESENQKQQLENKVNQFVEEIDVLKKSL